MPVFHNDGGARGGAKEAQGDCGGASCTGNGDQGVVGKAAGRAGERARGRTPGGRTPRAEFVKRINSNKDRINALEKEAARLKKAAAYASMEALPAFMARLGLEAHLPALQEEELDVGLLRSMGRDELAGNMASLGLSAADATRMADDLFPAAVVS